MKKLLVCTDGSHYSQVACQYAAWLAKGSDATVSVLYVTDLRIFEIPAVADLSGSMGIQPFEGMVAQLQEVEKVKANFVEERAMSVFEEAGLSDKAEFIHETGMLVDVVKEMAGSIDLVILGKRGENADFASEHLGSMLERVVRSIKVPCFVSNRKYNTVKEVAIAYDGSKSSERAIDFIASDASLGDVHYHVLSCVEGHKEDVASERLSKVESRFKEEGIDATYQVLTGIVESSIAEYVEDNSIDLLMLGAYGHSRIRELLIGSTTTELLMHCHVPVFCFR